jgi:HlyD family secretion protein
MNEIAPDPDTELARLGLAPKRAFWTRGRIGLAALTLAAIVVGAGWLVFGRSAGEPYVTAEATRGSLTVTVSATGTLQPESQVNVGAEVSGRVDSVNVNFNDPVRQGQVLAVINTDQIRAQLAQAEASLAAAKASVMTGEATVTETADKRTRAQGLFTRGIVSQQDLQTAEADYARAVAAVAKAKADVQNAAAQIAAHQTTLGKAAIRSPIDGIVLDRKVEPGQTVASSFQTPVLFTLASDLKSMQLQVDIDEADIGQVHEGQTATFAVDAFPQRRFQAQLVSLRNAPKTDNGVVTYQGVLSVDNSEALLRPGLTATADILTGESKDALLVPNGALRFTPPQSAASAPPLQRATNGQAVGRVWVLENGKPSPRDLRIGRTDGRVTEVIAGELKAGDRVITDTQTRAARS